MHLIVVSRRPVHLTRQDGTYKQHKCNYTSSNMCRVISLKVICEKVKFSISDFRDTVVSWLWMDIYVNYFKHTWCCSNKRLWVDECGLALLPYKNVFMWGRQLRFESVFMTVSGDAHIIKQWRNHLNTINKCFIFFMYVLIYVVCVLNFCDLFWSYVYFLFSMYEYVYFVLKIHDNGWINISPLANNYKYVFW